MAAFGSSSFGGFGSNNQQQQQQGTGFGTGTGFGGTSSGTGFGSTSSPFGNTGNTGSGFGSSSGGFGTGGGFGSGTSAPANTAFGGGQNRGFGTGATPTSTGGGGMFGSNTQNTSFGSTGFGAGGGGTGGFGSNAGTTTGGGGIFGGGGGASRPSGFGGAATTQGGSMFGGGGATTGGAGFGSTTGTGFGSGGTALAGATPTPDGTANPPFSPFVEKDNGSSVSNHYQSINFMQPYQKFSFEELRVADYNQGRRYGNASGQAGAFGNFSGFGQQGAATTGTSATPFGATATSTPFGASTAASSGFGQTQTAGGFGGGTGSNPLFGASKPSTGLFGQTSGAAQPSGFGTSGTSGTTGGFGGSTGGGFGGNTGGGLFGNAQQNKGFGATTGSGFGATAGQQATTSGTGFGGTAATSSPFGGQQQQAATGGFGGFGQNQAQTQTKSPFGGFGGAQQTQAQPQQQQGGGIFGGAGAGGSAPLFGGANQQQQGSSLFQNPPGQQAGTSGGIFGGATQQQPQQQQEQKPGSGLFGNLGSGTTGTGTGGFGLGGGQTQQQPTSLFGGAQQQQKPGGLFAPASGQSGGIFGQQNAAPANSGSLFNPGGANQNAQQQQTGGLGTSTNSLFGQSQPQQQQAAQQQPQTSGFQTSLLEGNPYGTQSIFSGLPPPNTPSPGPLATPLSASIKQKQRTPLPMYKITPNAANRLVTPPTRQGYGFSYSTYGSPSSNTSTPGGLGSSVLGGSLRGGGGSIGRNFSKSLSSSNLRNTWDPETNSILSPGAFTAGSSRSSGSNLKRLTIDRSLRTDLFTRSSQSPAALTNGEESAQSSSKLKKKVSFDDAAGPGDLSAETNGAVVPVETESPEPTAAELGFLRSARKQNKVVNGAVPKETDGINGVASDSSTTDAGSPPQMEQVRGKELAAVPEDRAHDAVSPSQDKDAVPIPKSDPKPGEYWTKPSRAEISKMSREQQKQVTGFTVGRSGCGCVTFDRPVDLTAINFDDIFGDIVKITTRSITVYSDPKTKPPRGKGLNVPSTLRVENSWPRGKDRRTPSPYTSGPTFDRHVNRLKGIKNTEFVNYEAKTGTWIFTVQHYTTYGLDYEDDDEDFDQSTLSAPPDSIDGMDQTPTQSTMNHFDHSMGSSMGVDESLFDGSMTGMEDDTFEFKKRKAVPGAFSNQATNLAQHNSESEDDRDSFLDESSMGSDSSRGSVEMESEEDSAASELGSDGDEEMDMAGSFPVPDQTMELSMMGSPRKPNLNQSVRNYNSPANINLNLSGNWAQQLNRTISPRKQDRQALREMQDKAFASREDADTPTKTKPTTENQEAHFATSIDLMHSLFPQQQRHGTSSDKMPEFKKSGLKWPYPKKPKTFAGKPGDMAEVDVMFHNSIKPRWGPFDTLIVPTSDPSELLYGNQETNERRSVMVQKLDNELTEPQDGLQAQKARTNIRLVDNTPHARLAKTDFGLLAETVKGDSMASDVERWTWQLGSILFNDDIQDDISDGVPLNLRDQYRHRIKKDRLGRLWGNIIRHYHSDEMDTLKTPEERAILYLCSHRVEEACKTLVDCGNAHLATLVSQIGRDSATRDAMRTQIDSWRQQSVYSEMSEPIRGLYELLAGNCVRSDGKLDGCLENRVSTFYLSDRFELDWIQAFGLRLWYGISDDDSLEAAVSLFHHDLSHENEPERPVMFEAQTAKVAGDTLGRESPLWVMLKSYTLAMNKGQHPEIKPLPLPEAITPEAVSGNRLHNRLSFQLYHHLWTVLAQHNSFDINKERADRLIWDYAWELSTLQQYAPAIFVLLHLSRSTDRERGVKEILARFAAWLPEPTLSDGTTDTMWNYLTVDLQLPLSWLWISKALYARDSGDIPSEVDYLIRAKHWNEAHETFRRVVAPKAVIERDYTTLGLLLKGFGENPETKVRGWAEGGSIYEDFLHLIMAKGGWRDPTQLKRLVNVLGSLGGKMERTGTSSLEEKVAFREMSRMVARWVTRDSNIANTIQSSAILNLPLTQDARYIHTAEVSRKYYTAIMAGGSR